MNESIAKDRIDMVDLSIAMFELDIRIRKLIVEIEQCQSIT